MNVSRTSNGKMPREGRAVERLPKWPLAAGSVLLAAASLLLEACLFDGSSGGSRSDRFPTGTAGLDIAEAPRILEPGDGDTVHLAAAPVKKVLKGRDVRMLAYAGSIPGPTLRVKQGSRIVVRLRNGTGLPTTLHSHGVRLESAYDGGLTAGAVPDGKTFDYTLSFPDAGLFWYHPHVRQDYAVEMGLYGNIVVTPSDSGFWRPVDREQILMVDDFFLDPDRGTSSFRTGEVDRTLMGRFGNLYLVNGDTAFRMTVMRKERVRFLATNASNARVVNLGFLDPDGGTPRIKLVGSDNGPYEWFDTAASALVAPGERKMFEACFDRAGEYRLTNHMLKGAYTKDSTDFLGTVRVLEDSASTGHCDGFLEEEGSAAARASIDSVRDLAGLDVPPAKSLLLTGTMDMARKRSSQPEPISIEAKGIEWYDHMPLMNEISHAGNTAWVIRDLETGRENHAIHWTFAKGEKVKIRIRNDSLATHPMPHPFHLHGQRFLVTAVNGRRNLNMAWKDTYLVGIRETVDILLDASNPGEWMAQCHIAEHVESMMMFHFTVE